MAPIQSIATVRRSERLRQKLYSAKQDEEKQLKLIEFIVSSIILFESVRHYLYTNTPLILTHHFLQMNVQNIIIRPVDVLLSNLIIFYKQVLKVHAPNYVYELPIMSRDHETNRIVFSNQLLRFIENLSMLQCKLQEYLDIFDSHDCRVLFRKSAIENPTISSQRYMEYRKRQRQQVEDAKFVDILIPIIVHHIHILSLKPIEPNRNKKLILSNLPSDVKIPSIFKDISESNIKNNINVYLGTNWREDFSDLLNKITLADISNSCSTCNVCLELVPNKNFVWSDICCHYFCLACTNNIFKFSKSSTDIVTCPMCRAQRPIQSLTKLQLNTNKDAWFFSSFNVN